MKLASAGVDLGIVVKDVEPMLHFYRDVLGLHYEGSNPVGDGMMHRLWAAESMRCARAASDDARGARRPTRRSGVALFHLLDRRHRRPRRIACGRRGDRGATGYRVGARREDRGR